MSGNYQGKMARGAMWMILFKWVERSLGLVSTVFLVRLLSPEDFGMVSMALSFIFMAELLAAFSFDVALIQNQNATVNHYHSAWTANVMLGGLITLIMLAFAVPIGHFYKQPDVWPVICALSLGPLLGGLENIGIVAFRKELDFRKEFVFQVSRKVMAFCTTIPLAFMLQSYWALVAGILVSKGGGTAMSYWAHPFRPRFSFSEMSSLMRFSKWLLVNNLVNFFKERSSDFVIGRFFGAAPLGLYNVSNEFASLPANEMGAPINRALLPGLAKMAGQPDAMRKAFTNMSGLVAVLAIPAGFGIFAVAPYLVPVVLGKKWLAGVPVMEVLSINSSLLVFHGTIITALFAAGKPSAATRTNLIFVVLMLAGMFTLTGRYGSLGAAISVLTACVLTTPMYLLQLRKYADVPVSNFFRVTLRPVIASLAIIAAVRWVLPEYHLDMPAFQAGAWLAAGVATGAAVYSIMMAGLWTAMGRPDGAEQQVLDKLKGRFPAWVPVLGKQAA
jgi:lipopolysaccharide exporter